MTLPQPPQQHQNNDEQERRHCRIEPKQHRIVVGKKRRICGCAREQIEQYAGRSAQPDQQIFERAPLGSRVTTQRNQGSEPGHLAAPSTGAVKLKRFQSELSVQSLLVIAFT